MVMYMPGMSAMRTLSINRMLSLLPSPLPNKGGSGFRDSTVDYSPSPRTRPKSNLGRDMGEKQGSIIGRTFR